MSKERDMRRTDWKRITKRRYTSREDADIFGNTGRISLTSIEDAVCDIYLTGPAIVVAEGEYLGR